MNISIFKKAMIVIFALLLSLCLIACDIENVGGSENVGDSENVGGTEEGGNTVYTVKFDTEGCLPIPDQQVEKGKGAVEPEQVTLRLGYRFDGWDFDFSLRSIASIC